MRKTNNLIRFSLALFLLASAFAVHAKDKPQNETLDCNTDSLQDLLDTLIPTDINIVEFSGDCQGLITIEGFSDLTLIGIDGGSISGVYVAGDQSASTTALDVVASRVTLQDVTINSGNYGLFCTDRSACVLRDVTVQNGHYGVAAQDQTALDILGSSLITNNESWGVSAFGASTVNMRPSWDSGFDPAEAGPVVSGNGTGLWIQDGSFFRSDNVTVSGNGAGVRAQRDAVIKMFVAYDFVNGAWFVPGAGVNDNSGYGFYVRQNSTAQIGLPVQNNGGSGIRLGSLSFLQNAGLDFAQNGGDDVSCEDVTAFSGFCPDLNQTIGDLQARIDALEAEANASLEDKVAGKTYAYRTTGHGITGNPAEDDGDPLLPNVLQFPQRDFSVGEGTLELNEDNTWNVQLALTIVPSMLFFDETDGFNNIKSDAFRIDIPITADGTWSVDTATNEIILVNDDGVQRLQASPNGEVLTVVGNDQRLSEGSPNTFVADAVYIQLPE